MEYTEENARKLAVSLRRALGGKDGNVGAFDIRQARQYLRAFNLMADNPPDLSQITPYLCRCGHPAYTHHGDKCVVETGCACRGFDGSWLSDGSMYEGAE